MGTLILILFFAIMGFVFGTLGAWTGAGGSKMYRRVILPAVTAVFGIFGLWNLWAITLMARSIVLSLGYGIPDPQSKIELRDEGSAIGRFWWKIFTHSGQAESAQNMKKTGIATRGTIGFLEGISIIAIPFIVGGAGAWALWFWAVALLVINNMLFGEIVKNEGQISVFGKKLNLEEIAIHGIDTIIIILLILLCR